MRFKAPTKQKKEKKVNPPVPQLPRNPNLSRELLPLYGISDFTQSIKREMEEFKTVNEFLPSLSFVSDNESQNNLLSPIESFSISGDSVGYVVNLVAKLKGNTSEQNIKVFVKRVHLVEPIAAMEGLYILPFDGCLPKPGDGWRRALTKIHDKYNEAYVDALCAASLSRLVETGKSPHWARFYGTFNARVDKYMYNITDEYQSLRRNRWFDRNKAQGLFNIVTDGYDPYQKPSIDIVGEDSVLDNYEQLAVENDDKPTVEISDCESDMPSTDDEAPIEIVTERLVRLSKVDDTPSISSECGYSADSHSDDGILTESKMETPTQSVSHKSDISSRSGSKTASSKSDSESNQCDYYAEFRNFPVQVTFHEYCTDTMDRLLDVEEETEDETFVASRDKRWSAWVYQVIAGLVVAQYHYGFVHNDLHTNNIMWSETADEYIYYKLESNNNTKYYRVPTYGKLMKIIDFGRASFWLKERQTLIISDAYAEGNDAGGQYNCEPYFNSDEPEYGPNPSFDLCRLAVSMFDAIFPEQPDLKIPKKAMAKEPNRISYETESELYNLLWTWLTDSEGKNILRNPDDTERFPDFDLYKHIGKFCKNAIPREQATHVYFDKQFCIDKNSIPENVTVWDLPLF